MGIVSTTITTAISAITVIVALSCKRWMVHR